MQHQRVASDAALSSRYHGMVQRCFRKVVFGSYTSSDTVALRINITPLRD